MGDMAELDNHFLKLLLSRPAMVLLRGAFDPSVDGGCSLHEVLFVESTVAMERRYPQRT